MLNDYQELTTTARRLRRHIIRMIGAAGSGHPGGSLSAVEIMTALYFKIMRLDPARPDWPERDRFVLSKGHAAPVLYAALAERGFFPLEKITTLRQLGSPLQGHPDRKALPGVEVSTGSLGHGLAVANGMALAGRLDGRDYHVYVLLGDGELEEGMVWEGAMAAAHYRLDNLTAIVDHNHLQIDGRVEDVMSPEPVADKFRAFGWEAKTIDGHDFSQILAAFEWAREVKGKPAVIIAETIKGKGVSFMENEAGWHGKAPKPEEVEKALAELA
ncbi:transketolase [Moorella sp. E306M]|uniref:transketolase n=1 Tax=Moorella sp. E306M TaxID=2572683 RepID=UPI0010FFAFFE|nr:transketolase [Moorella sp. E306M]GEA17907.1 transketolase [Moorella sp. E306M]